MFGWQMYCRYSGKSMFLELSLIILRALFLIVFSKFHMGRGGIFIFVSQISFLAHRREVVHKLIVVKWIRSRALGVFLNAYCSWTRCRWPHLVYIWTLVHMKEGVSINYARTTTRKPQQSLLIWVVLLQKAAQLTKSTESQGRVIYEHLVYCILE